MNKKYLLMFGAIGLFAVALVAAAVLQYYGQLEETVVVTQPITVNGDEGYFNDESSVPCWAGETCDGETPLAIHNAAPFAVPVSVDTFNEDDEVETVFFATTELTMKEVEFGESNWAHTGDPLTLRYSSINEGFVAEVTNPIEGYELVYYQDGSERFDTPSVAIPLDEVIGTLPYPTDANAEDSDYCGAEEDYDTCNGAKIWYVPSEAILAGNELDWSMADEFYFETELIQFNTLGELMIYPDQTLTLTPSYIVNPLADTDDKTVVITILPTA